MGRAACSWMGESVRVREGLTSRERRDILILGMMMVERGRGKEETKAGERQSDGVIKWERVSTLWTWTKDAITVSHCGREKGIATQLEPKYRTANQPPRTRPIPGRGHPRPNGPVANPRPRPTTATIRTPPFFLFIFPCYSSPSSSSSPLPQSLSRYGPGSCTIVSFTLLYLNPPSSTEPPSFQTPPATSAFSLRRVFKPTLIHLSRPHTSQTPSTNWLSIYNPAKVPLFGSHRPSKQ